MRSEKEIRKKEYADFSSINDLTAVSKAFDWILEGEPRYSIDEIEKIFLAEETIIAMTGQLHNKPYLNAFFDFIKQNPGKVKKILGEGK